MRQFALIVVLGLVFACAAQAAPLRVSVTVSATETTEWSATESNLQLGSLDEYCWSFGTVAGGGHRTITFSTPAPLVLSAAELVDESLRPASKGVTAVATAGGAVTETFNGASNCANGLCPSRAFGWFSHMFPDHAYAPCDVPLASDQSGCTTTTFRISRPSSIPNQNHDQLHLGFGNGGLGFAILLEEPRPMPNCAAYWPMYASFGSALPLTPGRLQQQLRKGSLVIRGSADHAFPVSGTTHGTVGQYTQHAEWVVRFTAVP